jgi:hypothetical protein
MPDGLIGWRSHAGDAAPSRAPPPAWIIEDKLDGFLAFVRIAGM